MKTVLLFYFFFMMFASFAEDWSLVFSDDGTGDWTQQWFLEGDKAKVENGKDGMIFSAGPVPEEQASHAVLWTKQSFSGDLKIEYDYTRLDSMTKATSVNILYIQATGLGTNASPKDIWISAKQRNIPMMKYYFLNMNALHVSYACSGPKRANYVAARRYPAKKLSDFQHGTQIQPIYNNIKLFKPGETWRITAVKEGKKLVFTAKRNGKVHTFKWDTSGFPVVTEGRVGFRHMWARSSRYQNIKIFTK